MTAFLKEVEQQQDSSRCDADLPTKRRILLRIQQSLIAAQEVGDEKLQIVQTIQDLIENKARQLELDYRNLGERFCCLFLTEPLQSCLNGCPVRVMRFRLRCSALVFKSKYGRLRLFVDRVLREAFGLVAVWGGRQMHA